MKLLKLCIINIKRFFERHTVMAIIMIIGIILSSCSLNLYVSQNYSMLNFLSGFSSVDKAMDFDATMFNSNSYTLSEEFIADMKLDVDFYSAMSVQYDDIDVIGINTNKKVVNLDSGTWLEAENTCVVPYEINGKQIYLGDIYTIDGVDYTVCGLYDPITYSADLFSSRRMSVSDYSAVGIDKDVEFDESNPYSFDDRSALGVFICYSDFVENGYTGDILRIMLNSSISDNKKENIASDFTEYIWEKSSAQTYLERTASESADKVYSLQFISKFLISMLIVLLSVINTLSLFNYILTRRKNELSVYISVGATRKQLLLQTVLEYSFYVIISYCIGFFISKIIVKTTDLSSIVPYYGVKQFVILLAAILFISITYISVKQCLLLKNTELQESVIDIWRFIKRTNLKSLYLSVKNYSSGLLREIVILLQVMMVAFSMSYVSSFYWERDANKRMADRMTDAKTVYLFNRSTRLTDIALEATIADPMGLPYSDFCDEAEKKISSLDGITGYGSVNSLLFYMNSELQEEAHNSQPMISYGGELRIISPALISNLNMKLQSGVWLDEWSNGVDIQELGYIPVVISQNMAEEHNLSCGDILTDNTPFYEYENWEIEQKSDYAIIHGENGFCFDIKIVGILSDNSHYYEAEAFPTSISYTYPKVGDSVEQLMFCPYIYNDGKMLVEEGLYYSDALIFTDNSKSIDYYREALQDYGYVYSISELAEISDNYYKTGTSEYSIHLCITTALLIIGVAGYNLLSVERNKKTYGIYYSCGMPWKKSLSIAIKSNSVIFLLGGIIGTVFGIISANSTRTMAYDTIAYSALTSLGFILILFALSTISIFAQISKLTPISLIRGKP